MHEGVPPLSESVDITLLHEPFCRLTLLSREHDWRRSEAPGLGGVSGAQIIPPVLFGKYAPIAHTSYRGDCVAHISHLLW